MKRFLKDVLCLTGLTLLLTPALFADTMEGRINSAVQILAQKQQSAEPIPPEVLDHAKGVAIFSVSKDGKMGEGIVIVRRLELPGKSWTAPCAFNLEGLKLGKGLSEAHYIIVLNTDQAVERFTGMGKTRWDTTSSIEVDSKSKTESLSNENLEKAVTIVYRDSDATSAGASLAGSEIYCERAVNHQAYGNDGSLLAILSGETNPPKGTAALYSLIGKS